MSALAASTRAVASRRTGAIASKASIARRMSPGARAPAVRRGAAERSTRTSAPVMSATDAARPRAVAAPSPTTGRCVSIAQ